MQTNSFEALGHGEAARSTDTFMSLTRSGREAGSGSRPGADQGDQSTGCGHACPVAPGSALPKSDRCRVSRNGYDCLNREQTGKISAKRRWLGADDGFAERIAVDDAGGGEHQGGRQQAKRAPKRDHAADHERRKSDKDLGRRNISACKMKHDAEDQGCTEGKHRANTVANQRGQNADADDGCEMIEPDDRMSEPGQQPLHEGDGKLAAHHMVGQRRNWREYRSTRCKHAKFLEQGSIEQSLHRGPPSWWALCALDWCRFRRAHSRRISPLVEPSHAHRDAPRDGPDNSVPDGRSPGSRVPASGHLPGFPVVSWPSAHRLQLRGQPRLEGPMPLEASEP